MLNLSVEVSLSKLFSQLFKNVWLSARNICVNFDDKLEVMLFSSLVFSVFVLQFNVSIAVEKSALNFIIISENK